MAVSPVFNGNAILQFSPDWQQSVDGDTLRGGTVGIDFAPGRITGCRRNWRGAEVWDIEAFVRFHPRGELTHGSLMERNINSGIVSSLSPKRLNVAVPSDTTKIEMWFHNFAEIGGRCDAWDSRFGENYWFDVGGPSPTKIRDPVRYRQGTRPAPDLVNVTEHSGTKRNVFPSPPDGSPEGTNLRTSLNILAWVKNIAFPKDVWIDVHVFDRDGGRIQAAAYPLTWQGSASGVADLFRFDGEVYQGSIATPGSVSPKPNAWLIQYRLYYAVEGQTYTDAIPYQLELPDDAVI